MSQIILETGKEVEVSATPTYEIFYNDGFGIYNCELDNKLEMVIKGNFPLPLQLQQVYQVKGKVVLRKFDKQIEVSSYEAVEPKGEYKVITYLQQLKGLKRRAETIYEQFGDESIELLKTNPEKVSKAVKGISVKKAKEWQEELLGRESKEDDVLFLLNLGLTGKQASQLIEDYGSRTRRMISDNPYVLLSVKGASNYGFLKCDELAKKMDFDYGHPGRIKEGLIHCLKEAGRSGHTYLPKDVLITDMEAVLGVRLTFTQMRSILRDNRDVITISSRDFKVDLEDMQKRMDKIDSLKRLSAKEKYRYPVFQVETKHIERAIDELITDEVVSVRSDRIALTHFVELERVISENAIRLSGTKSWKSRFPLEKELASYLMENQIVLEAKQEEAVKTFSEKNGGFYILNGSAGCGKTFTLKIILDMLKKVFASNNRFYEVEVLAPTGKAAKVASKSIGGEAKTVHRGLEYNPGLGFQRNKNNPLSASILIVDETSMMDVPLASSLLEAIRTGTKVIFLGDTKQLSSVGPGNVLHDLINSNIIQVVTLDVGKRQSELSGITKNANLIIEGKMMETCDDTKDAYIMHEDDDKQIQLKTLKAIKRLLSFPDYTLEDIQVLVPQKRGSVGVHELNAVIQEHFNPNKSGEKLRNYYAGKVELYFMKGDKVIHTKNNYDKVWYNKNRNKYVPQTETGITNGETGIVEDVIIVFKEVDGKVQRRKRIIVKYELGYVFYEEGDDVKEIDHAYCLSIHKSQGSQWKAVIMPISSQHSYFLDRNLIYTAWTRAELFGLVVGPKRTLAISIKKILSVKRNTQLQDLLINETSDKVA